MGLAPSENDSCGGLSIVLLKVSGHHVSLSLDLDRKKSRQTFPCYAHCTVKK